MAFDNKYLRDNTSNFTWVAVLHLLILNGL